LRFRGGIHRRDYEEFGLVSVKTALETVTPSSDGERFYGGNVLEGARLCFAMMRDAQDDCGKWAEEAKAFEQSAVTLEKLYNFTAGQRNALAMRMWEIVRGILASKQRFGSKPFAEIRMALENALETVRGGEDWLGDGHPPIIRKVAAELLEKMAPLPEILRGIPAILDVAVEKLDRMVQLEKEKEQEKEGKKV
jgi:hypothetical protein